MTFTLSTTPAVDPILHAMMLFHMKPTQPVFVATPPSDDDRGREVDGYFSDRMKENENGIRQSNQDSE